VSANNYDFIARLWQQWSPGFDGTADVAAVREALGTPDHLAAALGYYRTQFDAQVQNTNHQALFDARFLAGTVPILYLHGANDGCVRPSAIGDPTPFLPPDSRTVTVEHAGHFLQLEQPDVVNQHITAWLET
jgi:pimeloyl-ACP methyl ester carboxylesterase